MTRRRTSLTFRRDTWSTASRQRGVTCRKSSVRVSSLVPRHTLLSAFGFAAQNRGAAVGGRENLTAAYDSAKRKHDDLQTRLVLLAKARPDWQPKSGILRGSFRPYSPIGRHMFDDDLLAIAIAVMPRMRDPAMQGAVAYDHDFLRAGPMARPHLVGNGRLGLRGLNAFLG